MDKGKLSRTLKLNLESLIQLGSASIECLKVTCNREGALFQRNCSVCQDKKETYTDWRRETAAAGHYQGRGCKTNRQWEKGWGMLHISSFTGPEVLTPLTHRMKSRAGSIGPFRPEGLFARMGKAGGWNYLHCAKSVAMLHMLQPDHKSWSMFGIILDPTVKEYPRNAFPTTCESAIRQNRLKSYWFLEVKWRFNKAKIFFHAVF